MLDASLKREAHQQSMAQAMVKEMTMTDDARQMTEDGQGGPSSVPEHPMLKPMLELIAELKRANAPKRIVRDHSGKAVGVEPVPSP